MKGTLSFLFSVSKHSANLHNPHGKSRKKSERMWGEGRGTAQDSDVSWGGTGKQRRAWSVPGGEVGSLQKLLLACIPGNTVMFYYDRVDSYKGISVPFRTETGKLSIREILKLY